MALSDKAHEIYKPYIKQVEPLLVERNDYDVDNLSASQLGKWKTLVNYDANLVSDIDRGNWKKPGVKPESLEYLLGTYNRADGSVFESVKRNEKNWDDGKPLEAAPKAKQFDMPGSGGSTDYVTSQKEKEAKANAENKEAEETEKAGRSGRKTIVQVDLSKYAQTAVPKVPIAVFHKAGLDAAFKVAKAYDWKRDQDKKLLDDLATKVWDSVAVSDGATQTLAQVLGTTTAKVKDVWKAQAKLWDAVEAGKKGAKQPTVPSPAMTKLAVYPSVSKKGTPIRRIALPAAPAPGAEGADDSATSLDLMSLLPWVVGGVAVAGVALLLYSLHKKSKQAQMPLAQPLTLANPARAYRLEQRASNSHGLAGRQLTRHNPSRCTTCN